jgi:uncharacterized protein (DUF305 family)
MKRVDGHQKAIALREKASKESEDAEVKALAATICPSSRHTWPKPNASWLR